MFFSNRRYLTGRSFLDLSYPDPLAEVRHLELGSVRLSYTDHGQGDPPLVFIHGLGSYLPVWKHNVRAFAADHRVVTLDLPGFGKSSKRNAYPYSMEFFATAVQDLIHALDLRDPVIVGHSMGGQIALTHALRFPGSARGLVVTSSAGFETFAPAEARWLLDTVDDDFTRRAPPEAVYARHSSNFHRMPKDARFMAADRVAVIDGPDFARYCRAVSKAVRGMLEGPVHHRLSSIETPTLVLFGEHDALIPNPLLHPGRTEALARDAVRRLPRAELSLVPRAGHLAHFEQPHAWNQAVHRFLSRLPASPGASS